MKRSQEALVRAREFDHPFTLADVLAYGGCLFARMRQDARALRDLAEKLLRLASKAGFPDWYQMGLVYQGEALAMLGQPQEGMAQIRAGIANLNALAHWLHLTHSLCTLAEAEATAGDYEQALATLDEAFTLVEKTGERNWEAELNRVQAEMLLSLGRDVDAEVRFQHAIEVARCQGARSWELRATTGLARLWQEQGRFQEARQMLANIYDWFTEGFDTPDLLEARALLDELSST
jgi:predicted ATPase